VSRRFRRRWTRAGRFALVLLGIVAAHLRPAAARSLSDVFRDPRFARLELAPLGPALADTVAATYPVASASSSVVYAYNPALETLERRPGGLGPIFGERAETLGQGGVDVALTYSYVHLSTIDGAPLDGLGSAREVKGRFLFFPVRGGVLLRDGRFASLLPVRVGLDIGVDAHIVAPSLTYGVSPDVDVNITLPLLHTALSVDAMTTVPDPRFPEFALAPGDRRARSEVRGASAESDGVGDVLVRAKYVVRRGEPLALALGLGLALPTGRSADLQGTGTTRLEPLLIASRTVRDRIELFADAGMEVVADDVARSVARWALGGTVTLLDRLALPVAFLGRHELAAPTERIALPFFFQIERSDAVDASVGLRWQLAPTAVLSANALVPVNRDGLRADVVPTLEVEYVF